MTPRGGNTQERKRQLKCRKLSSGGNEKGIQPSWPFQHSHSLPSLPLTHLLKRKVQKSQLYFPKDRSNFNTNHGLGPRLLWTNTTLSVWTFQKHFIIKSCVVQSGVNVNATPHYEMLIPCFGHLTKYGPMFWSLGCMAYFPEQAIFPIRRKVVCCFLNVLNLVLMSPLNCCRTPAGGKKCNLGGLLQKQIQIK